MTFQSLHLWTSVFICGSVLIGCVKPPPRKPIFTGPTETMSEVVQAINTNNRKLPTLFASIRELEASIVDDRGKRHNEVMGGRLLYRSPNEVLLIGNKPVAGDVVTLGSNEEQYWLVAKAPGPDTTWWGWYRHLGKPCAQPIPMRPDLVLEVLGITMINEDFNQLPAPVMRYNNDADAYMFIWNAKLPDRWIAVKEIWYDRQTKRPTRIALFDAHGRPVLHAFLSKHKPVKLDDVAESAWPVVPGEYRLFFPESGSRLRMELGDVALTGGRIKAPNDRTFRFNPGSTGVSKVIQLDEACDD